MLGVEVGIRNHGVRQMKLVGNHVTDSNIIDISPKILNRLFYFLC